MIIAPRLARQRGFTLLELLLVLAIMGLLIGVSAPQVGRLMDALSFRTQSAEAAAEIRELRVRAFLAGADLVYAPGAEARGPVPVLASLAAKGWRFSGEPIVATAQGVCLGGEVTMRAPSGRAATFSFQPPDCGLSPAGP